MSGEAAGQWRIFRFWLALAATWLMMALNERRTAAG